MNDKVETIEEAPTETWQAEQEVSMPKTNIFPKKIEYWDITKDLIAMQEAGIPHPLWVECKLKDDERVYGFMNYSFVGTKKDYAIITDKQGRAYGALVKASRSLGLIIKRLASLNKERNLNE